MKSKKNYLEAIWEGKTRDIAWLFFIGFTNISEAQNRLKNIKDFEKNGKKRRQNAPNKINIPYFNKVFKNWKDNEFLYTQKLSQKIKRKNKIHEQKFDNYIFNLRPFFEFAEQRKKIILSKKEKRYLEDFFSFVPIRKAIFFEFSEEGFIQGMLKFYLKFCLMPFYLKQEYTGLSINKWKKFYGKIFKSQEERLTNVKKNILDFSDKDFNDLVLKSLLRSKDILKSIGEKETNLTELFYGGEYAEFRFFTDRLIRKEKEKKELLKLDKKIMAIFGILPESMLDILLKIPSIPSKPEEMIYFFGKKILTDFENKETFTNKDLKNYISSKQYDRDLK